MYQKFESIALTSFGMFLGIFYGWINPELWAALSGGVKTFLFGALGALGAWSANKFVVKPIDKKIEKYGSIAKWLRASRRNLITMLIHKINKH
jgi:hypothetical protein